MPSGRLQATRHALRSPFPWIALSVALVLTLAGWLALLRSDRLDARQMFERRAETAVAAVRSRMVAYEQVLRSGAAYMASSSSISREDWRRFIGNLQLDERFPGIQSVGYAEHVTGFQRMEHTLRMRAEGFANYQIRPDGERDEMAVVVYNEPAVGRNLRAIGFDAYAEPTRRAALDRTRDTGEAAITGAVTLAGESHRGEQPAQVGFVMYVPVYQDGLRDLPRSERRHAVMGYVFAPFRMNDLMRGILDEGVLQTIDMRILDAAAPGAEPREMLDTREEHARRTGREPTRFESTIAFPMPGRAWTIRFHSRPEFDATVSSQRHLGLLGSGLVASLIVFFLVTALVESWNRTHDLSMRDPLTGLFNRRYVEETMAREIPRAEREGRSVGLIVLDLDHFKQLNDTYGHNAGDFVLARMGELLRNATRGSDIPCRFGGEEFGLILPGATLEVARLRADAIRAAYNDISFEYEGVKLGHLTLSAGVCALAPGEGSWSDTAREADRALYAAKQQGRNRVVAMEPPPKPPVNKVVRLERK